MKKEKMFSLRVTVLLYLVVLLLPLNYLIVSGCQEKKRTEIEALNKTALSMALIQHCAGQEAGSLRQECMDKADALLEALGKTYVGAQQNREVVALFRTDELFAEYEADWRKLKESLVSGNAEGVALRDMQSWDSGVAMLETIEQTLLYQEQKMINLLFISLALCMLALMLAIYFVRVYMRFELNRHATRDMLTGLYNRGYLTEALRKEQASAKRHGTDLALLEVEIIGFSAMKKRDAGHAAIAFADFLNAFFRASDTISYIGNGQFVIAAPRADATACSAIVDRLLSQIAAHDFMLEGTLKVAVGAVQSGREEDAEAMMRRLAGALKKAKSAAGGGRCLLMPEEEARNA